MAEYRLAIYASESLRAYAVREHGEPHRPQSLAGTFVEGAFERTNHSVSLVTPSTRVPAPVEQYKRPFTAPCPEDDRYRCSYTNLRSWFGSWFDATGRDDVYDATVLLTNTDRANGGMAAGDKAVAMTGQALCELPCEYEPFGYTRAHDAVHTVLHEIGHVLMRPVTEPHDGVGHHDVGSVYDRPGGATVSAMGVPESRNACGEPVDRSALAGVELTWSACCQRYWRPPRTETTRQ